MKKRSFFLWPLLLILSFFVGKQMALFFGRDSAVDNQNLTQQQREKISDSQQISKKTNFNNSGTSDQQLHARLMSPYPKPFQKHTYAKEQEMIYRLSLLQDLATAPKSDALFKIYEDVLLNRNEEWIVQRQVLKNIQSYWTDLNEKQRDRLLSQVDLRARSTWNLSDREFVKLFESVP